MVACSGVGSPTMTYPSAPLSSAKFVPGHFIKINPADLSNATNRADIVNFINANDSVRGAKVVKFWGDLEISGALTGPGIDDWDLLLNELNDDKYLIIALGNKCFGTDPTKQLPLDLMTQTGNYTDAAGTHMTYQYLWASKIQGGANDGKAKDYFWKIWDSTLQSRYAVFLDLLSAKYDDNPRVCRFDTLESSYGPQLIPAATLGFDSSDYEAGWITAYTDTTNHFSKTPYIFHTNFPRPFLYDMSLVMPSNYIGLGAPNSNQHPGYLTFNVGGPPANAGDPTDGTPPCGMVYYYPYFDGTLFLAPEVQGDDYESSTGNYVHPGTGVLFDYPSYQSIYERCRDVLFANTIVWQRISGYWAGGSVTDANGTHTAPSLKTFLSTHPDIINDGVTGGLNTVQPTNLVRP